MKEPFDSDFVVYPQRIIAIEPSRRAWRALVAQLDALDDAEVEALVPTLEAQLARWPAALRRAPGRWIHRRLCRRPEPRLRLAARLDLVSFADTPYDDRLAWADADELSGLRHLEIYDEQLDDAAIERLCRSPWLHRLEVLRLRSGIGSRPDVGISCHGAARLASCPALAGLHTLDLSRNRIGAAGLAALRRSPYLAGLTRLHLGRNRIDAAAVAGVLGPTSIRRLELLDLDHNRLDGPAIEHLVASPLLTEQLRELVLSGNRVGPRGCAALAGCSALVGLQRLFLHACQLDDRAVAPLLGSPYLHGLDNLALSGNALGMDSVHALAACAQIDGIGELDVCHNRFTEREAEPVLRRSPYLAGLRRLCL